jgi:glycosyltransferase involved in cell wall biosynthesis
MLWGHGRNFTASNHALDGTIESWLANRAAQVFTYTDAGKKHVVARGLNEDRVTVVVNSTDTRALREAREATRGLDPSEVRNEFGLGDGPVLLFVGAFDAPKQLPFLFDAMDLLVERLPNIQLVLAGAGPDEAFVRKAVEERPYAHLIGRLEAEAFGRIAHIVELVVMPGRVGLVAVDALALGLPVATTRYPFHAPEVDYLVEGANSVWADFDIHAYANLLQAVLSDTDRLAALQVSAGVLGRDYSVEASASRFVSGLLDGLAHS